MDNPSHPHLILISPIDEAGEPFLNGEGTDSMASFRGICVCIERHKINDRTVLNKTSVRLENVVFSLEDLLLLRERGARIPPRDLLLQQR